MEKRDFVDVAFVVPIINEGVLYLKRNDNDDIEPGKWCIPSGHVENGESYESAAKREFEEETGIKVDKDRLEYVSTFNYLLDGTYYKVWLYMIEDRSLHVNDVKLFPEEHSAKKCIGMEALDMYAYARNDDYSTLTAIDKHIVKNYLNEVKMRLETRDRIEMNKSHVTAKA
jgi:8-oxo-dGTP pyrophosphatase MutT (NUDIX family)